MSKVYYAHYYETNSYAVTIVADDEKDASAKLDDMMDNQDFYDIWGDPYDCEGSFGPIESHPPQCQCQDCKQMRGQPMWRNPDD